MNETGLTTLAEMQTGLTAGLTTLAGQLARSASEAIAGDAAPPDATMTAAAEHHLEQAVPTRLSPALHRLS
jgi:hypothetical protein